MLLDSNKVFHAFLLTENTVLWSALYPMDAGSDRVVNPVHHSRCTETVTVKYFHQVPAISGDNCFRSHFFGGLFRACAHELRQLSICERLLNGFCVCCGQWKVSAVNDIIHKINLLNLYQKLLTQCTVVHCGQCTMVSCPYTQHLMG